MSTHLTGFYGWTFKLNTNKARLGVCKYNQKSIELSVHHVDSASEPEVRDTLLHEIAHVMAGVKAKHGFGWRRVALSIGCNGLRCGTIHNKPAPNFIGTCAKCGTEIPRYRLKRRLMNSPTVHHLSCGPEGRISWRRVQ